MYEPLRMFNFEAEFLDIVHPHTLEDISDALKLAIESVVLDKAAKTVEIVFRLFKDGILDIYECLDAQQEMVLRIKYLTSEGTDAHCYDLEKISIVKAETRMSYTSDTDLLKEKIVFTYGKLNALR